MAANSRPRRLAGSSRNSGRHHHPQVAQPHRLVSRPSSVRRLLAANRHNLAPSISPGRNHHRVAQAVQHPNLGRRQS